jgi:phage gp16-like protein
MAEAAALRTAAGKDESRKRMIGAVRAACARQGIGEEDRRALQREVTGKGSLAEMNLGELGRVLDRLNNGWKGPMGHRAYLGKIRALWWTLYWLGAVDEPGEGALSSFVARQTGKHRLTFLGHQEAFRVIEALKSWAERAGVVWPTEAQLAERRQYEPSIDLAHLDRHAVLTAIAAELAARGVLSSRCYVGYLESALGLGCNHWRWTAAELDAGIRLLGKKLRRAAAKPVTDQ